MPAVRRAAEEADGDRLHHDEENRAERDGEHERAEVVDHERVEDDCGGERKDVPALPEENVANLDARLGARVRKQVRKPVLRQAQAGSDDVGDLRIAKSDRATQVEDPKEAEYRAPHNLAANQKGDADTKLVPVDR